jgi:ParB family transcriptional regulator, chromosome partitioning protein
MEVREIEISRIGGSLCRMRLERDYERDELLASIRECGVMEPIKVKKVGDGYLNFTGHRRLDCAKELGLARIRAEVWDDISDGEAVLMGFVENINRKDFTILEEGHAYRKLVEEYGHAPEDLVAPCGKSRTRIFLLLRLVKNLTPAMERAIREGEMTSGHGEWLLRIEDANLRERYFRQILAGEMILEELKYYIYRLKPDAEKTKKELLLDIVEDEYEKDPEVRQLWKKSVAIRRSRGGDKITIEFTGPLDLLGKLSTLAKPLKTARSRFRTVVGRNAKIP